MLHVISADLPGDCLALESLLSLQLAKNGQPPPVLDLTGESLIASVRKPSESFLLPQALSKAWDRVHPEVSDWLKLLQLVEARPEAAPTLPGIESLLQCFALAEWFPPDSAGDSVVLLPPLHGALQLLELARSGPALLEQWSQPLLEWWRNTRRQLASLDLLLRLELPDGQDLVLSDLWRRRLERLAACLEDGEAHRCWLALDGGPTGSSLLADRLCRVYLAGFQPTRLWVVGPGAGPQALQLQEAFWPTGGGPWVSHGDALRSSSFGENDSHDRENSQADWIQKGWCPEKSLQWEGPDAGGAIQARLLLPGLRRELLQVKQLGTTLVLQLAGQSRRLKLPELGNLTCGRARQEGRHLILEFIPD